MRSASRSVTILHHDDSPRHAIRLSPARREWLVVLVLTLVGGRAPVLGVRPARADPLRRGDLRLRGPLVDLAERARRRSIRRSSPMPRRASRSWSAWRMRSFGVADVAAILVSIACGVLTIPVAAWLGRRTFGPGAGAAAAAFAALSLAARRLLAEGADRRAVPARLAGRARAGRPVPGAAQARPRRRCSALAVGLAQNFKYNGWLAGVIVVARGGSGPDRRSRGSGGRARSCGRSAAGSSRRWSPRRVYWPWYPVRRDARRLRRPAPAPAKLPRWAGVPGSRTGGTQLAQVVALSGGTVWGAARLGRRLARSGVRDRTARS